ncbi:PREDICTED: LOC8068123 isoform [Prunus dulcis]|uniref:PREDICTED: LOC8068123 isoform n=1 Tax=Prunus dulcis TaxID=3755 RepID=A0A5E4FET5_PRUDU|nr:uncharacterized protein LOC117617241 [Prunus dulcis]VVA24118.1 PREDICTED: LOC8068123 isoform [Prunus dulcis]
MDLWVLAAAAATEAAYVAKYCWHKWLFKEGLSESVHVHGQSQILGDSVIDSASASGGGEEHLAPKEMKKTGHKMEELTESSGELVSDFVVTGKAVYYFHDRLKKSRYLGIKYNGHSYKALDSTENCFLAQVLLYREHARVEEDVDGSCASSASASPCVLTMRPLLVNNGRQVIGFASVDFNEVWLESEERELEKKCGLKEKARRRWQRQRQRQRRCSSSTTWVSGRPFHSQGSKYGMLLFLIGITIGIMYTIIAHKREVDKLNESRKQTQKLVQDLHKEEEEVEMKDSLNLKELSNLGFEFQGTDQTVDDDAEAMSKIESELLAELELLELNVNTYSLSRTPDIVELDPDFVAGVVEEDLRLDKVNWEPAGSSSDSDHEEAMCPRELSLRLHEVIESRLEARIMELETALGASQKRGHSMDFEHVKSKRDFNEFNRDTQRSL